MTRRTVVLTLTLSAALLCGSAVAQTAEQIAAANAAEAQAFSKYDVSALMDAAIGTDAKVAGSAAYALGRLYASGVGVGKDNAQAVNFFMLSAKRGSSFGIYEMAVRTRQGNGVAADQKVSADLFKAAADMDNANAAFTYAMALMRGIGVPSDFVQSRAYFTKAAELGNASATERLTLLDSRCQQLTASVKDNNAAGNAAAGDPTAQYLLGAAYHQGCGVPLDVAAAKTWYAKAAAQTTSPDVAKLGTAGLSALNGIVAP